MEYAGTGEDPGLGPCPVLDGYRHGHHSPDIPAGHRAHVRLRHYAL